MNPEIRDQWAAALESGDYEQGRNQQLRPDRRDHPGAAVSEQPAETMDSRAKQVRNYTRLLAERGYEGDFIVAETSRVVTCDWPLRRRLALAWKLVTNR